VRETLIVRAYRQNGRVRIGGTNAHELREFAARLARRSIFRVCGLALGELSIKTYRSSLNGQFLNAIAWVLRRLRDQVSASESLSEGYDIL